MNVQSWDEDSRPPKLILVVDDEEMVLRMVKRILESHGYRVVTASDGTKALEYFSKNKDVVSAVITDMNMPQIDGPATVKALRQVDPKVKIIASSGVRTKADTMKAVGECEFLAKPYSVTNLLETLGHVL